MKQAVGGSITVILVLWGRGVELEGFWGLLAAHLVIKSNNKNNLITVNSMFMNETRLKRIKWRAIEDGT